MTDLGQLVRAMREFRRRQGWTAGFERISDLAWRVAQLEDENARLKKSRDAYRSLSQSSLAVIGLLQAELEAARR